MRLKLIVCTAVALLGHCLAAEAQRYDRGYDMSSQPVFVDKGSWMVGGTGSYKLLNSQDFSFMVADGINSSAYGLSVSPAFCYMIKDNKGLGLRIDYQRSMVKLDSAAVNFGDMGLNVSRYHTINQGINAKIILRDYIPIAGSRRFALVNELQLAFGYGQGKVADSHGIGTVGSYETTKSAGLYICPGLMAFASEHLAVEFSVNMLGLGVSRTDQTHNQVDAGSRNTSMFNFKVNVLSVGFGMYYYL